jgi:Fe-S oxidoreductase/nitrate reductase gamma subunit
MSPLVMTILLAAGLGVFSWTAVRRWRLMRVAAAPDDRFDAPKRRIGQVLRYVFGQARMFRYSAAGVAHAFIFAGFVILALRTLILFARGYASDPHFGFWIFDDDAPLGRVYLLVKDLVAVLVIVGVAYFLYLRLHVRPRRMELSREGIVILLMIVGIVLSDLAYEAAAMARAARDSGSLRGELPAASALALALRPLPDALVSALSAAGFWLHAIIVLAFLNFLPYGKHFHVLTILPQVYFANPQPRGRLAPITDIEGRIEREQTLGVRKAADFSWKAVLDFYTCTECGRCSDHCPAFNTGKLLSPKHLTMTLRDHFYRNERALVAVRDEEPKRPSDVAAEARRHEGTKAHRDRETAPSAGGTAVAFVDREGRADESSGDLVPLCVEPEVLWACTTCGACEQECPVFISYVDKIVDMRRHLVMERGEFPDQLQNAFRGLETVGNPYSFANEHRADWAAGLDVPLRSQKSDAEVLYWVGCAPSFDDRSRKIARAMATLLKVAGVDFAILGPEERCTGDPARRAGNEYLYQILAQSNVETLNNYGVRTIVTTCPHCYNTIRNEYPEFGGAYRVIHHTEFLLELLRAGRLRPQNAVTGTIVFHDSCYLGRYNDIYDPPREILRQIPGLHLVEASESRDRGMCCGAGGAQMWKEEEHIRRPGSREGDGKVNHARARQLLRVLPGPSHSSGRGAPAGSRKVATACPFCMTMITDGLRDQGHDDVERLDVAEVLLRAVQG